jgi:hypothetical protein
VDVTSGSTPKPGFENRGAQRVPVRKSMIGISRKKSIAGISSEMMIPTVVTTDRLAAAISRTITAFSPYLGFRRREMAP